jgi:hypothetical protein
MRVFAVGDDDFHPGKVPPNGPLFGALSGFKFSRISRH